MDQAARLSPSTAPFRPIDFAPVNIACETTPDGGYRLRSRTPLGTYDPSLARMFRDAVEAHPGRTFLAAAISGRPAVVDRPDDHWNSLSFEACRKVVDC